MKEAFSGDTLNIGLNVEIIALHKGIDVVIL